MAGSATRREQLAPAMKANGLAGWVIPQPKNTGKEVAAAKNVVDTLPSVMPEARATRAKSTRSREPMPPPATPSPSKDIEDIDSEEDDDEFVEGKRVKRTKKRKHGDTKTSRKQQKAIKNQPSIMAFCTTVPKKCTPISDQPDVKDATTETVASPVKEIEQDTSMKDIDQADGAARVGEASAPSTEPTTVSTEEAKNEDVEMQGATSNEQEEAPSTDDNIEADKAAPPEPEVKVTNEEVATVPDAPALPVPEPPAVQLTSSGRPKRNAVIRAEQKLLDSHIISLVESPAVAAKPRRPRTAPATADSIDLTGSKKKRDATNKKPTSKAAAKTTFFMSEKEKKEIQEIEALSSFREELRQKREKDKEFFAGRENANPFFKARTTKSTSPVRKYTDVIDVSDGNSVTPTKTKTKRWEHQHVAFPTVQHVLCPTLEDDTPNSGIKLPRKKKEPDVMTVDDEDDANSVAWLTRQDMSQYSPQTASDWFWIKLQADRNPDQSLKAPLPDSEKEVIHALSRLFDIKERRLRHLLESLEASKFKRISREANLSLVDRYAPVTSGGIVGNKDSVRFLFSWLSAWKNGSGERDRRNCFQSDLMVFEGDDSEDDDEGNLCRLLVLRGVSGSGKSAAVYACAEELGFQVIEINAAHNRAGRNIVDIAGEATQSTRVLSGTGGDKKAGDKKSKRASSRKRKSVDNAVASHLSLILFEDVNLVFEQDKGFYSTISSMAKTAKCPIIVTCPQLPDGFPTTPPHLDCRVERPSSTDFTVWLLLLAYVEQISLSPSLAMAISEHFHQDIRRSLHFLHAHRRLLKRRPRALQLSDGRESVPTLLSMMNATKETTLRMPKSVALPLWAKWPDRKMDVLDSNVLRSLCDNPDFEATAFRESKDRAKITKQSQFMYDTAEAMSVIATLEADEDEEPTCFFERQRANGYAQGLRHCSAAFASMQIALPSAKTAMRRVSMACSRCDARTLKRKRIGATVAHVDLPLATYRGENSVLGFSSAYSLDYMPMLSHIAMASAAQSDSRRRASRRNHYLRDVLLDMCVLDDLTQVPDKYVAPEDLLEPETVSDSEDQPLDDDIVMETDSDDGGDDAGATETAPDTIDATGDDEQVIGEQVVVQPVVTEVDEEGATYVEL